MTKAQITAVNSGKAFVMKMPPWMCSECQKKTVTYFQFITLRNGEQGLSARCSICGHAIYCPLNDKQSKKNPYKPGDWVIIQDDIRDAYNEIWHHKNSKLQVVSIHPDGNGLMFSSNLGIHWTLVKPCKEPNHGRSGPRTITKRWTRRCTPRSGA